MSDFENLHGMIIFARVVETLSYTEAAKTLGLAKSSVSKEISALEVRLGAKLLQRTTRRIQVTEVGMTYYHYCYRILHEVKSADLFIRQFHEEPTGSLRVVAPVTFGCQCIVPVLNSFVAGNIHVSIDLDLTDRPVNLEDDHFDIAIAITRDLPDHRHYRPLIDIAWGLYAAPGYLSKLNAIASPDDCRARILFCSAAPPTPFHYRFVRKSRRKILRCAAVFAPTTVSPC